MLLFVLLISSPGPDQTGLWLHRKTDGAASADVKVVGSWDSLRATIAAVKPTEGVSVKFDTDLNASGEGVGLHMPLLPRALGKFGEVQGDLFQLTRTRRRRRVHGHQRRW